MTTWIALIGERSDAVVAHRGIALALPNAATALGIRLEFDWISTLEVTSLDRIRDYDGIWCVPASPYKNMAGALLAIRHARESGTPFLGTCGGFQHAVIEYARHVLGWAQAAHGEESPDAQTDVIAPLACKLIEVSNTIRFVRGSRIATIYGAAEATEGYHCSYGINPKFQHELVAGPLRAAAHDASGEIRAVELDNHPFFIGTLFQPERGALKNLRVPLVEAFVAAASRRG